MAPKLKDMWLFVLEKWETAEAARDAISGMIDKIIKTAVFFSLHWFLV